MTMTATLSDMKATDRSVVEAAQDVELAALIRRLAVKRPEILTAWTPPPARPPASPSAPAPRIATPPATRSTIPSAPIPVPISAPAPVPVSRRSHPLPIPRPLSALTPHPVAGDHPTREAFPVDRDTVDSLARLRAIAAGTHRPDAYWPAHATDAYLAKKRRPTRWHRVVSRLARSVGPASLLVGGCAATVIPLIAALLLAVPRLPG